MIIYQTTTHDVIPVTVTGQNSLGATITLDPGDYELALVPRIRAAADEDFVAPVATASGAGTGMPVDDVAAGGYNMWVRVVDAAPLQPQFIIGLVEMRVSN